MLKINYLPPDYGPNCESQANCCGPFKNTGHNAVLGYTQSFGATTVLDARVAFNRYQGIRYPLSYGFNMTSLGLPASLEAYTLAGNAGAVFPVLTFQGYSGEGSSRGDLYLSHNQDWEASASLSRVMGRHTLTVGGETMAFYLNFAQP